MKAREVADLKLELMNASIHAEQMERGAQYANEDTQKRESELRASIADREALAQINTRQSMEM